jgi:DNA-directed RNA polymerase subunit M/transcription elongation factor TFIIS
MTTTFFENAEIVLTAFIKKKENREKLAKALWSQSGQNEDYATYLLYEILTDYMISPKLSDIFTHVKQKKIGWNHVVFQPFQQELEEYDQFLMCPPEVDEGVIQCSRCQSRKTFSFSKQTRRADESATVFVRCAECNHSFRM